MQDRPQDVSWTSTALLEQPLVAAALMPAPNEKGAHWFSKQDLGVANWPSASHATKKEVALEVPDTVWPAAQE
jgi:hypothetical protein